MTEPTPSNPEPAPSSPAPRFGTPGWILLFAAFAIGFWNFPLLILGPDLEYMPGDLIDNRLNLTILEHGYRYLTGKVDRFWDVPSFYPAKNVTAASDAHIGMLPLYASLRACGLSQERAFQGWYLIPFVLNFAAAAWAARRIGLGPVGTAAAAFVFTYGLPVAAHLVHGQLVPRFLVPLALVFACEWLRAPRSHWRLAAVAGCVVYQTYISVYIGYLLCLVLGAGAVFALILGRERLPWRDLVWPGLRGWGWRVAIALIAFAAIKPLVDVHAHGGSEVSREVVHGLSPRREAWVTPAGASAYWRQFQHTRLKDSPPWQWEEQLFIGVLPLGAVLLCAVLAPAVLLSRRRSETLVVVTAGACASVFLALLITKYGEKGEIWYYEPLLKLPGAKGIRAVGRVVFILLFPAGLALGAALDAWTRALAHRSRVAAAVFAVLALAAVAYDQRLVTPVGHGDPPGYWTWARTSRAECVERRLRVAEAIRAYPGAKMVYAFPSVADKTRTFQDYIQLDMMLAAQELDMPTVNGTSGHGPPGWGYPAGYRHLMRWLTEVNSVPPEMLDGLVVFGEPATDPDPAYDAVMRKRFPPRAMPPLP